jgi:hypothetical protein
MLLNLSKTLLMLTLYASQDIQTEWQGDATVTAADKNAIITLAKQLGIEHPQKISFDSFLPSLCPYVRVRSPVVEDGYHRTWRELLLRNRKWPRCFDIPRKATVKRVGQWIASNAQLSNEEEWRVEDQGWYVDLRPGPDISYGDVQLIVFAVRRGQLVNRLPTSIGPILLNSELPDIDPNDITSIEKSNLGPRMYRVRTGKVAGLTLDIRIVGDQVELHSYSSWIV